MKRVIITLLNCLIFTFSTAALWISCSNEDVPVQEEIPGSVSLADFDGTWLCTMTDQASFVPKGFQMTIQGGRVTRVSNRKLIKTGPITIDGDKIRIGRGEWFGFNFRNDHLALIYNTEYQSYIFAFKKQ